MSGWSSSRSMASSASASSRSASARSGSYSTSKALAALAADVLKLGLDGGGESKQEGDHFIHLQSELGDRRYRRLCEDGELALAEIHYCQEGLDIGVRINQEEESVKDLINHDYLVLTLEPGDGAAALHVMAHKLRGGVHVTHVDGSVLNDGVRCFTVQCRKRMRLWALVAILKLEDPDYCLRTSNCWDYAKNTAKRLVKACAEVAGISAAERARLFTEHDNLEANLAFRHMHNVAKSLLRRFTSSSSRNSLLKTSPPGASGVARVLSSYPDLSSPLISAPDIARVWNFSEAPELSSPLISAPAARVPSPELSSSVIDASAASDTLAGPVLSSARAPELSSPRISAPAASDLTSLSTRLQDFQQVADPASEIVNSEQSVNSGRMMGQQSESVAFPLANTGKVCLQIVFLMFWLVLNHLGLGPWVASLFGRS